ncbi:MAG: 2-succinyl-5-enolpyruvyl-6-hydroxy-3-cyclohexene-1-carboxylic-acid synthase [Anaerolineaceae bacterium]|nr:2-succinyl-5-enolpyruvyl-6-hydroxy-3-cyclohexene-1-carboxylic-acid synthase [Anaerolineaceae bacterium]
MNRNTFYATTFVDELARAGLHHVCAAPGSRHTPLMLAFAKDERFKVWPHLDERSASFFALGLARALDEPVALICTSGTAGANMYPAIIEAHQSRIPLLVITADRPPELRHSGANQTIDQIKMFGDFVLWFVDAALPESNPPTVAIRNLRTLADRALAKAKGLRKGVVHINMPFRKPLEPTEVEGDIFDASSGAENDKSVPRTQMYSSYIFKEYGEEIGHELYKIEEGLIICGPTLTEKEVVAVQSLASALEYPIVVDALSGARFENHRLDRLVGSSELMLDAINYTSKVILRFGSMPLSKKLNDYVVKLNPSRYIAVSSDDTWSDDAHLITDFIPSNIEPFCYELMPFVLSSSHDLWWLEGWQSVEYIAWETIDHEMANGAYFDGGVVYDVVDLIPDGSTLFAGNSLPVRHLDQFGKPQDKRIYTYANRGASGIDGNISTALGAGAARPDAPLVSILGDITFYHDMNGLLAVHRCGVPVTIVLLNNDGGGIFQRLPINQFDPEFTEWFVTPHGLDYSHAAKMYGLEWVSVQGREEFRQAFSASVTGRTSTIIEFRSDAKTDLARRNEIVAAVHARLKELDL